ncbi:MAG: 2-amino-4-hydroxy-6-hydroxymethyldihydropteridine diphosphokinase [Bacteroidales bacterium]
MKYYILFGSNEGDRLEILKSVFVDLKSTYGEMTFSSLYESEPWGFESQNNFMNIIFAFDSTDTPHQVLSYLQHLEFKYGRTRDNKLTGYQSRTIDLDILLCDSSIVNTETLQIPHPRLHLRRFTLEPLNELNSEYLHPILKLKVSNLLNSCDDKSSVKVFMDLNQLKKYLLL